MQHYVSSLRRSGQGTFYSCEYYLPDFSLNLGRFSDGDDVSTQNKMEVHGANVSSGERYSYWMLKVE